MALVRTTLASAVATTDKSIVVASATGFTSGFRIEIDDEVMEVTKSYVSGVTIPVLRGLDGSVVAAHVTTAGVVCGITSDYPANSAQTDVLKPLRGKSKRVVSITATSSLTLPPDGADLFVILNGTSVITLTVPVPTKDMDGCELTICANGAAAHVLTFTGGLSGAGASYDVLTVNATAPIAFKAIACNSLWNSLVAIPAAGTVTNVTGTLA